MREYCTLFDSRYLIKALAMYRSLERHGTPFHLTAFAFDARAVALLQRLDLPSLTIVPLEELEDADRGLAAVKDQRSAGEYCWTATPALPLFLFDRRADLDEVTYLDADLLFFSSPEPLFDELGDASVLITPHRYPPVYAHHAALGTYNVQFITFRRTDDGLGALRWWRERCLEWCSAEPDGERFGDQKYLDDWPQRFAGVHVLQHPGGGLAPWNALGHEVDRADGTVTVDGRPLVFFHFHKAHLRRSGRHALLPAGYHIPRQTRRLVYASYAAALDAALREIRAVDPAFDAGLDPAPPVRERAGELRMRVGETVARRVPSLARMRFGEGSVAR